MTRKILSLAANCLADAHAERLPRERLRSCGVIGNLRH
jgi:hypothetical protein